VSGWESGLAGLGAFCGVVGLVLVVAYILNQRRHGVRRKLVGMAGELNEALRHSPSDAMPIDPRNPPKLVTYRPRDPGAERTCSCHGRALRAGQQVYWWPRSDISPGVVVVLCADVIKEAQK
jgi:hypothetical protein